MTPAFLSQLVRPHRIMLFALYAGAGIAAFLMLPGDSERIAALERDGRTREALQILEKSFAEGDRRQRTLYKLQSLYELYGNLPKLKETLELLAEERPRDAAVQGKLAAFYRQTHDEAGYLAALKRQIDLRYSEDACREAIGILRRSGKYDHELDMIGTCRLKGYRQPDDIIRLATLLAANGDTRDAGALLRSADDLKRLKADRERMQLFQLLIEANQPNEAHRRAVRWIRGSKNDPLALELIEALNRAKFQRTAIALARDVSVPGDSISLSVAETMLERGQKTAAKAFLRGWIEKAAITDAGTAVRVVESALDAGDPETALKGATIYGLQQMPDSVLTLLAVELRRAGLREGAERVRAAMREAPPEETPKVAAQLPIAPQLPADDTSLAAPTFAALPPDVTRQSIQEDWRIALADSLPPPEESDELVSQETETAAIATIPSAVDESGAPVAVASITPPSPPPAAAAAPLPVRPAAARASNVAEGKQPNTLSRVKRVKRALKSAKRYRALRALKTASLRRQAAVNQRGYPAARPAVQYSPRP